MRPVTASARIQIDRELIALREEDHAPAVGAERGGEVQPAAAAAARDQRRRSPRGAATRTVRRSASCQPADSVSSDWPVIFEQPALDVALRPQRARRQIGAEPIDQVRPQRRAPAIGKVARARQVLDRRQLLRPARASRIHIAVCGSSARASGTRPSPRRTTAARRADCGAGPRCRTGTRGRSRGRARDRCRPGSPRTAGRCAACARR